MAEAGPVRASIPFGRPEAFREGRCALFAPGSVFAHEVRDSRGGGHDHHRLAVLRAPSLGEDAVGLLFGVVTNLREAGDEVIRWHRERCGRSEAVHGELKSDLAGGRMPSGQFGANAAWWAIAVIAHNLNVAMKRLVLGPGWVHRRMKALRFHLIALPGRVVRNARRQVIRLSAAADTLAWIQSAQRCIQALARASPG